ncbi:hypothetical protein [Streptomyces sp. enrichment culture]|uniref:hypothetical protein n=1 Tax=Streptomyces sp. enrichment culture TaxID=1795815 RepID=UPI003F55A7F4
MSARLAAARFRTVAAAALVAAIAGTAALPATATAAEGTSGNPLTMTLGAPTPDSTLKRDGETRSMTLTVTNSSDTAQDFQAWLNGAADGPSPLLNDSVVFDVTPLNAPATKSSVGRQDNQWQGLFYPASGNASSAFSVPAKSEFTWKVTVGLGANYATNNGDFTLKAAPLQGKVTADPARNTVVFKTEPAVQPGKLEVRLDPTAGVVLRPGERADMALSTRTTGPGEFPADIDRTLVIDAGEDLDFGLEADVDGRTVKLAEPTPNHFELPALPKDFGAGQDLLKLKLSLDKDSAVEKETSVRLHALYSMNGEAPFVDSLADAKILPAKAPSASPSTTPSTQPSATPTATPTASDTATATPTASQSTTAAAGTTGSTTGGMTTTGSLASTGSGAGLYATAAGVLLAAGFAVAALGKRRRTTA